MPTTIRNLRNGEWITRETLTAGEARQILAKAEQEGLSGMSKVNKSLTKQQGHDILLRGIAKYGDGDAIPAVIAKNIKREFGGL